MFANLSSQTVRDIIIALVAATPGILLGIVALRKAPAETHYAQHQADLAQASASEALAKSAKALAESLSTEVANLRHELAVAEQRLGDAEARANRSEELGKELQRRLTDAESRLARAEDRAAGAEKRANEFRNELIQVGHMLDESRKEHQRQIDELVLVIQSLIEQIEQLGGKPNVDKATLDRIASLTRGQ